MSDREQKLSPNFKLGEFVPEGQDCPPWIVSELQDVCTELLEPIRRHMGGSLIIHSGWRPAEKNAATPGASNTSDHVNGRAADFHVTGNADKPWFERTIESFHWARETLSGKYGQIILEDHRKALDNPAKLWVHIASPSVKHPGTGKDPSAVLTSSEPKQYARFVERVPPSA